MYSMNTNFLLKDELQYELNIRGINSEADVQTLRKLFRSVVAEGLRIDLCNLYSLSVEEIFVCVASKIWSGDVTEFGLVVVDATLQ